MVPENDLSQANREIKIRKEKRDRRFSDNVFAYMSWTGITVSI